MTTVIAFIGFGEAGGLLAAGLKSAGAEVRAAFDILIDDPGAAAALKAKAEGLGVIAAANNAEAVAGADVIISAVVSNQAVAAAQATAPHLKAGQFYLDINSTAPAAKREAAAVVEASGAAYVEAAVMDLVPPHGHKVPMLLAGAGAADLAAMLAALGMNVRAIGPNIGDASSVKMIRSVFMKGFTAILLECLTAAHKLNAEDAILDSLQVTFPELDWRKLADYYAGRLVQHAGRQSHEMYDVAETLESLGVAPLTALASAKRLGWLADFKFIESEAALPENWAALMRLVDAADADKSAPARTAI